MDNKPLTVEQAMRLLRAKTLSEFAERIGTSRQAINYWVHSKGGAIPRWWTNHIRGMAK